MGRIARGRTRPAQLAVRARTRGLPMRRVVIVAIVAAAGAAAADAIAREDVVAFVVLVVVVVGRPLRDLIPRGLARAAGRMGDDAGRMPSVARGRSGRSLRGRRRGWGLGGPGARLASRVALDERAGVLEIAVDGLDRVADAILLRIIQLARGCLLRTARIFSPMSLARAICFSSVVARMSASARASTVILRMLEPTPRASTRLALKN